MSGKYDNILRLPHPTSAKHPRMPVSERAAIFSPFAALSGHAGAIAETARLTDQRIELDEDTRAELDRRQTVLLEHIAEQHANRFFSSKLFQRLHGAGRKRRGA